MPVHALPEVDLDRLLKLRLVVARHGEMDRSRWWNTQGMLGRHGALVLERGFPRTHFFAQARVVFAVARARCQGSSTRRAAPPCGTCPRNWRTASRRPGSGG